MNKKIVLGLGLCLLLTVINLHRAMDNYGITDAKFKVGVLAEVSSSSSSGTAYGGYYIEDFLCIYTFSNLYPSIHIILFNLYHGYVDDGGNCIIRIEGGQRTCVEGWLYNCVETNCELPGPGDVIGVGDSGFFPVGGYDVNLAIR